jgi:Glycosyltransferase family 92
MLSLRYIIIFALIFMAIVVEKVWLSSIVDTSKLRTTATESHERSTYNNYSNHSFVNTNESNHSFVNNQSNLHLLKHHDDHNHANSTIRKTQVRYRYIGNFKNVTVRNKHMSTTVEGKSLPGPFNDDTIFLLGVRLTTSYESDDSQVHVDVFGYPGDFVGQEENRFCDVKFNDESSSLSRRWENLTKYNNAQMRGSDMLFCQLECQQQHTLNAKNKIVNKTLGRNHNHDDCGDPIPMSIIPLESDDGNQNQNSLIWRCNVTHYLNKATILLHSRSQQASQQKGKSVRVSLYWNDTSAKETSTRMKPRKFTQIDIPLYTGVVGYAGAQIRPNNDKGGYFTQSSLQSSSLSSKSIRVGMCVSLFESHPAIYLPEFLQHHINIGIDQFLIGIAVNLNSTDMGFVEDIVRPYMEKGFVVMQAFGLTDYFPGCSTDQVKLQFYHHCLYHFKGLTKYVVTWDVDEYWIPPHRLEISGNNNFTIHREGTVEALSELNDASSSAVNGSYSLKQSYKYKSDISSYSSMVTKDKFWKVSNYSKSISIHDAVQAMEVYQKRHGCEDKWCYYVFPSYLVGIKPNIKRSHLIGDDFLYREAKSNLIWKKGLVQTRFAMMNGFHVAGSCTFPEDPNQYFSLAKDTHCNPISFVDGEFGSIHHFISLILYRDGDDMLTNKKEGALEDEYVVRYSETVKKQLKSYNRTPPIYKSKS